MSDAERNQVVGQVAVDRNEAHVLQPGLRSNIEMVCGENLDQTVGEVIDAVAGKQTAAPTATPTESETADTSGAGDGSEYGPAGGWLSLSHVPKGDTIPSKWCTKLVGDATAVDEYTSGLNWIPAKATWWAAHTGKIMECDILHPDDPSHEDSIRITIGFPPDFYQEYVGSKGAHGAYVHAEMYANDRTVAPGNPGVDDWLGLIADRLSR